MAKYFWLKLHKDFFKRHDIRIVESMPNGKDYILFYLKLLVESIDHEGTLRFSETIPYNEQMLSVVTNTNIDTVKSAMEVFRQLNMIEILDDSTIYMTESEKMIGSAKTNEDTRESTRNRVRAFRERQKNLLTDGADRYSNATCNGEIDIEIDKDIEIKKDNKRFAPPSIEDVADYCRERSNNVDPQGFIDYYSSNGWMVGKNKMKDWKATVRNWERREKRKVDSEGRVIDESRYKDIPF